MSEARDQISSYLLGELDAAEADAFERRLETDLELHEEVERLRPLVARLEALPDEVWEAAEPPPLVMPEDAAKPTPAKPEPAGAPPARSRRLRLPTLTLRPLPAAGLAALLLAIGVGGGLLIDANGGSQAPGVGATDLVLTRIDDGPSGAHGDVLVASDQRRASVDVSGLDPSGSGRFYELWLLDEDGRMIALGAFQVGADGRAEVELPIPVAPSQYRYFDVSLQEDNGDPAHSGISVLRGPTSS
jgi:anti-sigma-K factor RskA